MQRSNAHYELDVCTRRRVERLSIARTAVAAGLLAVCWSAVAAEAEPEGSHADEHHPNLAALFVGLAQEGRRENGLALGLEYERRLHRAFGVAALAEYTFGDLDVWVFAVPLAAHHGRWKVYVAPGIEAGDGGSESLVRLGAEYAFAAGDWEVSPQLDVDFVDGERTWVVGLTFGKGF